MAAEVGLQSELTTGAVLRGRDRGSRAERRALAEVVIAKGGRRESDFVELFDAHRKLRSAIRRLARPRRAS